MKKIILSVFAIALCISGVFGSDNAFAGNVNNAKARQVASYFMASQFGNKAITADNLKLVYELPNVELQIPALYIFNTADNRGFVVVSGNENLSPIIAYSTDGAFDPQNIPTNMMAFLNEQAQMIVYAQNHELEPAKAVADTWNELYNQELPYFGTPAKAITKLLSSTWNQEPLYNNYCPEVNGQLCVTGCVATAMAQIMYYWKFPYKGYGQTSYDCGGVGFLSANFGNTYYDFDIMADELTYSSPQATIDAVALLNYHCGVSVMMSYDPEGSGTQSSEVPKALRKYFKYVRDSISSVNRTNGLYYNPNSTTASNAKDTAWVELLKAEIKKKRPIYYSAHDPDNGGVHAGHAFVCDGYNSTNKMMHFNWGWGGAGDCWCNVYRSLLSVQGYNFYSDQSVIIGIQPPQDTLNARNVGIVEAEQSVFTTAVYPNPSSDNITVSYRLQGNSEAQMQIYDVAGKLVDEISVSPYSSMVTVPVSHYAPGLYVCRLQGYSTKFTVR